MSRRLKVVFAWEEVNGYMAACWRALQKKDVFDISIVAGRPGALVSENKYANDITAGLTAHLLNAKDLHDPRIVKELFTQIQPDVIFIPGWTYKGVNALAHDADFARCRFIMGFDTPRLDTWRQRLARLKIGRLVERMERVVVPGERSWQFASKLLKVPEARIRRGLYGVDYATYSRAIELRTNGGRRDARTTSWPRKFLYTGRYAAIKGIDVLVDGYAKYRRLVSEPWPLTCCGSGPLAERMNGREGITNRGFVQPSSLCDVFGEHGVFILASRHDPWPLVLVEAASSGLPIICTNSCGSAVELVRPYYNGLNVATGDADDLAAKLKWIHEHANVLPEMGLRSQQLANAYSAESWAERWQQYIEELCD